MFSFLFLVYAASASLAQTTLNRIRTTELKTGDLIFQNKHCGALCDAIHRVTPSIHGRHFSHMGMLVSQNGEWTVIEATYPKVQEIPLVDFLIKSEESHWIGRLSEKYKNLHNIAITFAREQIGTPYDLDYLYDNEAYYCSELVYDAYLHANMNVPIFKLEPMTFKDPETGAFFKN